MIIVDDRAGSCDLFPYIKALTTDAIMTRLDPPFGDIAWVGNGPDGQSIKVGVEYKKVAEILGAIGGDNRFVGHQVGGMVEHYDRRFLLVEGRIRADRNTGVIQEQRRGQWVNVQKGGRGFTYRDLDHWLTSIEEQAQFRVVKTFDEYESARWVVTKHSWYVAKGWADHKTLHQFHVPAPPSATFVRPGLVRRVAKELKGVGWDKSIQVAAKFASVRAMANANERDWASIDGVGKTMSRRIVEEIIGAVVLGGGGE